MGEREPLDNPEPTHGICAHHKAEVLESLPSHSFPEVQLLVIVRQSNTMLYERLRWSFGALSGVKVIVDRRVGDRRAAPWQETGGLRHARTRRIRECSISSLDDFTVLRFTPKEPPTPALELDQRTLTDQAFSYAAELGDAEAVAPGEEAAR